jgi:hypothetical protein
MIEEIARLLQERADLVLAWDRFELGDEPPAPLEYDSMARLMLAAKAEIDHLRAELTDAQLQTRANEDSYVRASGELGLLRAENEMARAGQLMDYKECQRLRTEKAKLVEALRDCQCPRPANSTPDDLTAQQWPPLSRGRSP